MSGRRGRADDDGVDLSADEVATRIGSAPARPPIDSATDSSPRSSEGPEASTESDDVARRVPRAVDPGPPAFGPRPRLEPARAARSARTSARAGDRATLWRDASLLAALILAIGLGVQLGVLRIPAGDAAASPDGSQGRPGAVPPSASGGGAEPILPTIGAVVDPGLGLDASGRPIPTAASTRRPTRPAATSAPGPTGSSGSSPLPTASIASPGAGASATPDASAAPSPTPDVTTSPSAPTDSPVPTAPATLVPR